MRVPTVKVVGSNGESLIINKSSYNPDIHKLWGGDVTPVEPVVVEPEVPVTKNTVELEHKGGGRWVVNVNGSPVHEGTLGKKQAQALADEY